MLGEQLLKLGWISRETLDLALSKQQNFGSQLGTNLLDIEAITEEQLMSALSADMHLPIAQPKDLLGVDLEVHAVHGSGARAHPEVLEDLGEAHGLDDDLAVRGNHSAALPNASHPASGGSLEPPTRPLDIHVPGPLNARDGSVPTRPPQFLLFFVYILLAAKLPDLVGWCDVELHGPPTGVEGKDFHTPLGENGLVRFRPEPLKGQPRILAVFGQQAGKAPRLVAQG